jgi:hypothetical protein
MTDSDGKSGSPETKNQRKITRILVRTGAPVRTATRNVEVSNFNFAVFLPAKFDVQNGVVDTTNGDGTNRKITGNFYTAQILARDVTKKNFSRFSGIKITALSTEPARTGTNRHEPARTGRGLRSRISVFLRAVRLHFYCILKYIFFLEKKRNTEYTRHILSEI